MGRDSSGAQVITQTGYNFLLREAYSQLWALLRRFVALHENRSGGSFFPYHDYLSSTYRPVGNVLTQLPTPSLAIACPSRLVQGLGVRSPSAYSKSFFGNPCRFVDDPGFDPQALAASHLLQLGLRQPDSPRLRAPIFGSRSP